MSKFVLISIIVVSFSLTLSAEIFLYSDLPEEVQQHVIPDVEGRVLIDDLDSQQIYSTSLERELPTIADGWPVSHASSNCKNGAIYVNMDADDDLEILFGVGTKITALNLDGSAVTGWPVQLSFYIWSSPAAGDIDGDGEIEIVCTSRNNTTANSGELYAFELDGTPCTGFPLTQAGGGTNNVCLYDLDANGDMEILVNVRSHPQGWVYVFEGDGSEYPGFPQELDYVPGAGISAGDITGDGIPEIIALSYNKLHVYDLAGNLLPGFPLENTGYTYSYSQPILFDLDDDGLNEIIWGGCASSTGAVFAVNEDASPVSGWPQTTDYWIFGTVSLGDIDQDGSLDVVVGDQVSSGTPANHIYAWDAGGNAITGFPAGPTNAIYAQVGIADIDGDNNVELMIDDNNFGFGYDSYNHDGTHCTDWPLACGTVWSSTTMQITPIFGDVDNDNEIEIIGAATDIYGWVVECYLWETGEAWNEELAYMVIDGANIQHNGLYQSEQSGLNPPQNFYVDETGYATWGGALTDDLLGYNLYLDGVLQGFTTGMFFQFTGLVTGQTYTAGIEAVYDNGVSIIIEFVFIYNPNPTFNPPLNIQIEDWSGTLSWEVPLPSSYQLTGYNVYLDGMLVDMLDNSIFEYMYEDLVLSYTYVAGVSAVYPAGESDIIEVEFVYSFGPIPFPEPMNPEAVIIDYNDVLLTWDSPFNNNFWLHWDNGTTGNAIGLTEQGTFYVASHWYPADLASYDGCVISKIKFYPADEATFTIKVWTGVNTTTLVTSEAVTAYTIDEFLEVELNNPVTIDASQELWFGYEVVQTSSAHPAGADLGPAIPGSMISLDGTSWNQLSSYGFDYNWNLAAYVEEADGTTFVMKKPENFIKPENVKNPIQNRNLFSCVPIESIRDTRSLAGYYIYQDGTQVGQVDDPETCTYLVESLNAGIYEFTITAYYINPEGESCQTEPVTAEIILNPPSNLDAQFQSPNILLTWSAPERGVDYYRVYRGGILHEDNISGVMYIDIAPPYNNWSYAVSAVYDGGWESELSETVEVVGGVDADDVLVQITKLNSNFPNPFNPETKISFSVSEGSSGVLSIYNIKGQLIESQKFDSGKHEFTWNAEEQSSGIYFYKLKTDNYSKTKKMILLK